MSATGAAQSALPSVNGASPGPWGHESLTHGGPALATTAEALRLLDTIGADVIEVGLPFSDPYADGPVIQASAARALSAGVTTDAVMAMLKEVTPELSCPVVIFSYFSPIVQRGTASFAAAVKEAGVKGN